jgi:hypothetical protein
MHMDESCSTTPARGCAGNTPRNFAMEADDLLADSVLALGVDRDLELAVECLDGAGVLVRLDSGGAVFVVLDAPLDGPPAPVVEGN